MAGALYSANQATQTVSPNGSISLGEAVHKSCPSQANIEGGAITLSGCGYFSVTATATFTGSAGDAVLALYKDGHKVPGAIATETIATADTEYHTISLTALVAKTPCKLRSAVSLMNLSPSSVTVTSCSAFCERVM